MNRRHFIALTGGFAGLPASARPQSCAVPPHDCSGWSWSLRQTAADYPGTKPPNPALPLQTAGALPFQPATRGRIIPRRAWSTLDPHKDRRLIQDVKDAYCRMRSLPQSDPRSLLSQVWLHDYYCGNAPGGSDLHHTWAFLPWHRAFLYYHEQILGEMIRKPEFRLPYWDWDRQGQIPPFFLDLGLPDFLTESAGRLSQGPGATWADRCVVQAWLLSSSFTEFVGSEDPNGAPGLAVNGPHAMAHAFVGGAMRNPATAAADPVFFAHHGNVDRFWSYWQSQYRYAPPSDAWGRQEFFFHDAQCRPVKVKASDIADIGQLGYSYDLPSVPLCPFESIDFQLADFAGEFRLMTELKNLTLAGLISQGSAALVHFGDYVNGEIRYTDLLRPECFMSYPLQTSLNLPTGGLEAGKYYVLGAVREKFYKIGGFGVFASPQHLKMQSTIRLIATGCLDPEIYAAFLRNSAGFHLAYGKSSDGTSPDLTTLTPIDPEAWVLRLLYPRGYLDSAKELLGNFGIR